ncbi:unnamed protein product [Alopecurus aequalis]
MPPRGRKHWCKHCKKSFPSGKSLGGHMALHRNRRKKQRSDTPSTDGEKYGLRERRQKTWCLPDSTSSDDDPWALFPKTECQLCFKSFASRDALSIHMRVHMRRRNKMVVERNVSVGDGNHNLAIFSVPVRKKRSRRMALDTVPSPLMMTYGIEEEDAAHILVMLSGDHGVWSAFVDYDQDCEMAGNVMDYDQDCEMAGNVVDYDQDCEMDGNVVDYDQDCEMDGNVVDYDQDFEMAGNVAYDTPMAEMELSSSDHHGLIGDNDLMEPETSSSYEEVKFVSLSEVFKATTSYECKLCGRVFASARSLGSHKKGHRAIRKSAATKPCKQLLKLDKKLHVLGLPAPTLWNYRSTRSKSDLDSVWAESSLQGEQMLGFV